MSKLAGANLLLLALLVGHSVDHAANQPARELPGSAELLGLTGIALVAITTVLALRRDRLAPAASIYVGAVTAHGFVAVHLLPGWSSLVSDPYWDFGPNALSWVMVLAPFAAALLLTGLGIQARGHERRLAPAARS